MKAIEVLQNYQTQLNADGTKVGVSRQALDEVLELLLEAEKALWFYESCDMELRIADDGDIALEVLNKICDT